MMFRLSAVEVSLLVTLIAASALGFWWSFGTVVRNICKAKVDADFALRPWSPRVIAFLKEVVLQAKVIRERPLAGLAHACVFWGFCAFALVTLNHFATGFGLPLLGRDSAF